MLCAASAAALAFAERPGAYELARGHPPWLRVLLMLFRKALLYIRTPFSGGTRLGTSEFAFQKALTLLHSSFFLKTAKALG